MKKEKCYHWFQSDGGPCIHCRKTQIEIWDEEDKIKEKKKKEEAEKKRKKALDISSDALGGKSISEWERDRGHGFWGSSANGYVEDKSNR